VAHCSNITVTETNLKPVNGTAVDERWVLSQTVAERAANRTKRNDDVKVLATTTHKVCIDCKWSQLGILRGCLSMCQDSLQMSVIHNVSRNTYKYAVS